ncbi:hypothetical protein Tco_1273669 [Tanacetum coccineum]
MLAHVGLHFLTPELCVGLHIVFVRGNTDAIASALIILTNPVNTGSATLNTVFEEVTPGNIEAISPNPNTPVQTRSSLKKITEAHALFEPRKVSEALEDGSWVEAMQEELLQFKLQQVWVLVDLPNGAKVIDQYVAAILKKICLLNVKAAITPMENQVTPKTSHLNAVKRIFKYLKGKPNLYYLELERMVQDQLDKEKECPVVTCQLDAN